MASTILRARRPPWFVPIHADNSRPGLKNAASRRMRNLRVSSAATQLTRAPVPRCVYRCTTAPLHHCTTAGLLQPPQAITPPAHPLAGQPAGAGK
jgi:hypothetical protein